MFRKKLYGVILNAAPLKNIYTENPQTCTCMYIRGQRDLVQVCLNSVKGRVGQNSLVRDI